VSSDGLDGRALAPPASPAVVNERQAR
jgi:hypothetical protein